MIMTPIPSISTYQVRDFQSIEHLEEMSLLEDSQELLTIQKRCSDLMQSVELSEQDACDIVHLASRIRLYLHLSLSNRCQYRITYQQLLDEKLSSLVKRAIQTRCRNQNHWSIQTTAAKGHLLTMTKQTLAYEGFLSPLSSSYAVFRAYNNEKVPQSLILKCKSKRAQDEELLAEKLLHLLFSRLATPSFYLKENSVSRTLSPVVSAANKEHWMTVKSWKNFSTQPYLSRMKLAKNFLEAHPRYLKSLLDRCSDQFAQKALDIACLGFYDLFSSNIGFSPIENPEFKYFEDQRFAYFDSMWIVIDFKELLEKYLWGSVDPDSILVYETESGEEKKAPLKNIPGLQKALEVKWDLELFDMEYLLPESNIVGFYSNTCHVIPIRSALLEMDWGKQPLDQQTIQSFLGRKQAYDRLLRWMKKEDSSIRQRLSQEERKKLDALLISFFKDPDYSLRTERKDNSLATVKEVAKKFAKKISDWSDVNHRMLWEFLKQKGIDLTEAVEAAEKRFKVALSLFPRATYRQQQAFQDRYQRACDYLQRYQQIADLGDSGSIQMLDSFLQSATCPFSSLEKKRFHTLLEITKPMLEDAIAFRKVYQEVLQAAQPTYFNILKAMFPLLANFYALSERLYPKHEASLAIGNFEYSFEAVFKKGETYDHTNSEVQELISYLKQALEECKEEKAAL